MQNASSEPLNAQAERLLELWDRLGRTHMMAGGGCACGVGGVVVALEDFEQDIADYIDAEAERLDRADVRTILQENGRNGEAWSIPNLLSHLSRPEASAAPEVAIFVLERLGRTLQSFEKLHGGSSI